ncbi:MAG: calcium/sodium antiporter [Rhodobacter sp.]|nr:calcium/sodium antiporter [Rhodobacter sp.]
MPQDYLIAGLGLVILLLAGDALVRGAVNLSLRLGIPALIVSLTIVAFGTSAPELVISIGAVLEGAPGIALGNVVGSNTANVLLVLGLPALLKGLETGDHDTRRSYFFMLSGSIWFIALAFWGPITWVHGLLLLAALTAIFADQAYEAHKHRKAGCAAEDELEDVEGADPSLPWWRIAVYLALGLIGLPLGADLLVDSGISIARVWGVSETAIGLTLIAVGTSLPELATTLMAAFRRQADVALGNVIGSNMFNLLAIIGVAAFFGDIPVDPAFLRFDLWVMLGSSLLLMPFVIYHIDMKRTLGAALTGLYFVYVFVVLT